MNTNTPDLSDGTPQVQVPEPKPHWMEKALADAKVYAIATYPYSGPPLTEEERDQLRADAVFEDRVQAAIAERDLLNAAIAERDLLNANLAEAFKNEIGPAAKSGLVHVDPYVWLVVPIHQRVSRQDRRFPKLIAALDQLNINPPGIQSVCKDPEVEIGILQNTIAELSASIKEKDGRLDAMVHGRSRPPADPSPDALPATPPPTSKRSWWSSIFSK